MKKNKILSIVLIILLLVVGCNQKEDNNSQKQTENRKEEQYKVQIYTLLDSTKINKLENVKLAIDAINNITIKSGEEFSFNNIVGERTVEKGYKEATVIYVGKNGKSYETLGLGGGICQVSSTLYMACKELELEILERRPHSSRVDYCSIEDEAMINWGTSDFRFKNNLKVDITIKLYIEPVREDKYKQKIVCEIW